MGITGISPKILKEVETFNKTTDHSDWGMNKKIQIIFEKCNYNSLFCLVLDTLSGGFYYSSVKSDIRRALRGENNDNSTKTSLKMAAQLHRETIKSRMPPRSIYSVTNKDVRDVFKNLGYRYNPFYAAAVKEALGNRIVRPEN